MVLSIEIIRRQLGAPHAKAAPPIVRVLLELSVEKREMNRVNIPFVALQVATFLKVLPNKPALLRGSQGLIIREQGRLIRTHIGKNESRHLHTGIGQMANRLAMFPSIWLPGLIKTATFYIVEPPVIDAPQATIFDSPIAKIRPSVGTVQGQQAHPALVITKQDQILTQNLNGNRRTALRQFLAEGDRLPISAQELSSRCPRTDSS